MIIESEQIKKIRPYLRNEYFWKVFNKSEGDGNVFMGIIIQELREAKKKEKVIYRGNPNGKLF